MQLLSTPLTLGLKFQVIRLGQLFKPWSVVFILHLIVEDPQKRLMKQCIMRICWGSSSLPYPIHPVTHIYVSDSFTNQGAKNLPTVCEVTDATLFDPMLQDTYKNLPALR